MKYKSKFYEILMANKKRKTKQKIKAKTCCIRCEMNIDKLNDRTLSLLCRKPQASSGNVVQKTF